MTKQKFLCKNITCTACANTITKAVKAIDGVKKVNVNAVSAIMWVEYDENTTNVATIISAVQKIGYDAELLEADLPQKTQNFDKSKLIRLILSIVLWLPLIVMCLLPMIASTIKIKTIDNFILLTIIEFVLSLSVCIINFGFFTRGAKAFFHGGANMDTLVGLGAAASMLSGIVTTIIMIVYFAQHNISGAYSLTGHIYYESAATILTLVSVGKYIEDTAKKNTKSAIEKLVKLIPDTCTKVDGDNYVTVKVSELAQGDKILIKPGERLAVDGVVDTGSGYIDTSAITGESVPVDVTEGDKVLSGSILLGGSIVIKCNNIGKDTTLSKIISLVEEAGSTKPKIARIVDKVSEIFVPIVLAISLICFVSWLIAGAKLYFAVNIAVSVLVISCPCSLGLATPISIMVATSMAASSGMLIKNAKSLEQLGKIDTVVLDKTGTITTGKLAVDDIVTSGISQNDFLSIISSVEALSEHPVAKAIAEYGQNNGAKLCKVSDFKSILSRGVSAKVSNKNVVIGNINFIAEEGIQLSDSVISQLLAFEQSGKTVILAAIDKEYVGAVILSDQIRQTSVMAINLLKKLKIDVIMLTGDNAIVAKTIAKKLGGINYVAEVSPSKKASVVRELTASRKKVLMVGDGINDAPALASSTVSMAVSSGTDIAIDSADIVLTGSNLCSVYNGIILSRHTMNNILISLFWAFIYNFVGIFLAAGVLYPLKGILLSPMIASLAMSLSSLCVVANALTLKLVKFRSNNMEKVVKISGMHCDHCAARVKQALLGVDSTMQVEVNVKEKCAKIASTSASDQEIKQAIEDLGYKVKKIK